MRKTEVLAHFGSPKAVADALGFTRAAVGQWGDVVPFLSALRLEAMTDGKLKLDPRAYDDRGRPKAA